MKFAYSALLIGRIDPSGVPGPGQLGVQTTAPNNLSARG